jgi:hypothetical protein
MLKATIREYQNHTIEAAQKILTPHPTLSLDEAERVTGR